MALFVPVRAFYCFDPTDRALCESLNHHLAPLKHAGRLQTWDARQIQVGQEWEPEYDQQFSMARLLILLVSPKFLASERGQQDLQMALDRQQVGEATVVPILVRPCAWEQTELRTVQMLPRDHRALTQQANRDATWTEIVQEISRELASLHHQVYLIVAPEDQSKAAQLSEELAPIGITTWYLKDDHLSPDLHVEREAMRQASSVLLVTSPTAFSSRIVRAQKELAEVYQRRIEVVWARKEDGEWETASIWQAENRGGAPAGSGEAAKVPLLTRIKEQFETVTPTEQSPPQIAEPRNPYKGLRNFTAEDTRDFFGREALIDELAATVERLLVQEQKGQPTGRLLTVLGASGSGKSSVVLAGSLPHLKRGDLSGSGQWLYLDPMVPGAHPLEALALSLAQQPSLGNASSLHHELMADSLRTLHLLTRQLVGSSSQHIVLFIDQFEEVFAATVSEEERQHFFDLLITAAIEPQGPLLVMVTIRADFFDRAMLYPALYRLLDAHRVTVLPMERDELRQVIEAPARLPDVQITFEGDLVGDLLFDLRGQVGALPLLEFTLDQLFAVRSGQMFTLSAYREMGGVKGALAKRAQATYDDLPTKEHQKLARNLFLRLIDPGQSEQDTTRRRAKLSEFELPDLVQTRLLRETMDAFLYARLLTSNELAGVATIEVSHEALIREWPSLIAWLHEARQDILLQQKMSEEAEEWQRRRHPNDRLYRGSRLKEARAWAKRNTLSIREAAFLRASVAYRVHFLVSVITVVLMITSSIGGTGWILTHQPPRSPDPRRVSNLLDNNNPGSLRYAINYAPPKSTITFDTSLCGKTILLTSDDLTIARNLTIRGPDGCILSINSGKSDDIVHVVQRISVNISNLTFKGSVTSKSFIYNEGTLMLTDSAISGNTADGDGGGIYNTGTLTLNNSIISGNTADGDGGGIFNSFDGKLMLNNSVVQHNISNGQGPNVKAGAGGGILNVGKLTLTNSAISDNWSACGGGIDNGGGEYGDCAPSSSGSGIAILSNSTISENTATYEGGGIFNTQQVMLTNSTISGNSALDGGGISINGTTLNGSPSTAAQVDCNFTTMYKNTAHRGSDIFIKDIGITSNGNGTYTSKSIKQISQVRIRNSIVVNRPTHPSPDISGTLISSGHNLFQDNSGAIFDPATGKQLSTSKMLSVNDLPKVFADPVRLQNNGGPTQTLALAPDSPAVDQIPLVVCHATISPVSNDFSIPVAQPYTITADQRGMKRPGKGKDQCDIGAYESSFN